MMPEPLPDHPARVPEPPPFDFVLQLRFPADLGHVDSVRTFVQSFCEAVPLPEADVHGVVLASSEAAANAVEHGSRNGKPSSVALTCAVGPAGLEIRVVDEGPGFDYHPEETLDMERYAASGKRRGLGLYIIRQFADSTDYVREDGRNTLVIRRALMRGGAAGEIPPD